MLSAKVVALFLAFAVFLLLSNEFDWDHFFATNEADLQSWLLHHELPFWSNQICAGVTRLGDPQAFGLSPLFLPVLLFGSYFGLKILVLLLMVLGFWSLRTIANFIVLEPLLGLTELERLARNTSINLVCLSTIFGNYFLWHAHHGHLTFFQIPLVLAMIALLLKSSIQSGSQTKHGLMLFLLSWGYFSGGFYHSIVFFAFPLTLVLLLTLVILFFTNQRARVWCFLREKRQHFIALILGLIAGSYKVWGVVAYQKLFPRTLNGPAEPPITWETLIYQFVPTWNYKFFGTSFTPSPWSIWEYSAFSISAWIALVAIVLMAIQGYTSSNSEIDKKPVVREHSAALIVAILLLFIAAWFSMGSLPFSIHSWVNTALKGSLRVIGRYQFLFTLSFFLFSLIGVQKLPVLRAGLFKFRWVIVVLLIANMTTFSTLSLSSFFTVRNSPATSDGQMQNIGVVPFRDASHSYMLPAIRAGYLVPNCYNPINREMLITDEFRGRRDFSNDGTTHLSPGRVVPLVRNPTIQSCAKETYATANHVVLSESCDIGTCLNLNATNTHASLHPRLALDTNLRLICVSSAPLTERQ